MNRSMAAGCVAEFVGTFALVFLGAGAMVVAAQPGSPGGLVTVALAHGLALCAFVTATMHVSGGQFNPAVSIALALTGRQPAPRAAAFIGAQVAAAPCAVGLLAALLGHEAVAAARHGATIGSLTEAGDAVAVVGLEAVMSFGLMFVIMGTAVDARGPKLGGFAIGLVVAGCIVAAGPLTGASMNPARTLGPALFGHWQMHWAYWVGPVAGAAAAAVVYRLAVEPPRAA